MWVLKAATFSECVCRAEEAVERLVIGQVPGGGELEAVERDMRAVDIDRRDMLWPRREIAQHVAAARSDGDDAARAVERKCLKIDRGVLPDLRIDKIGECQREEPLPQPLGRKRLAPVHRGADHASARRPLRFRYVSQIDPP